MVECNGYPQLENGGEKLTIDEAKDFIKRMEGYFPNNYYTMEAYIPKEKPSRRYYNEKAIDGWEDIYQRNY